MRDAILKALAHERYGLVIESISKKTGFHRNTLRSHLGYLEGRGLIEFGEAGTAKVYRLTEKGRRAT